MSKNLYVQYGCGFSAPADWLNFDSSPTLRFERVPGLGALYTKNIHRFPDNVLYGDIVKGLPVEDESCQGVYCSHILEHLSFDDCKTALKNTYRILKPGGILRCVVPDLKMAADKYIADWEANDDAAIDFMNEVLLGMKSRPRGIKGRLKSLFGNSHHLWMWDGKSLSAQLLLAGFRDVRICSFSDCEDPHFRSVEDPKRFENAVAIECKK